MLELENFNKTGINRDEEVVGFGSTILDSDIPDYCDCRCDCDCSAPCFC